MKIANVEVDAAEITNCLDLAYHELKYVYDSSTVFASEVIRSNMPMELRKEFYRNKEFKQKLLSILKYSVHNGKQFLQYLDGKKKNPPKLEGQPLDHIDLELLINLSRAADLDPAPIE